jgi:hypothetical protein
MTRFAPWIVAVAMTVGLASEAPAQFYPPIGSPMAGQALPYPVGQSASLGYGYGMPNYVGGVRYTGMALPYLNTPSTIYQSYGSRTIAPYTTGAITYSSGYTGYVTPTAVIAPRGSGYPAYPLNYSFGYGPNFRAGNPYASGLSPYTPGLSSPYRTGTMGLNRGVGVIRLR